MRLINADKIIEYLDYVKGHADKYAFVGVEDILKIIENQPTVKAIIIPDNATNGDVMMKAFKEIQHYNDGRICASWWNEEYKYAAEGEINGSIFERDARQM